MSTSSDTRACWPLPELGEEEEEASSRPHSRATASRGSLQGAIGAQGARSGPAEALRGCGDTAEVKGFSITLYSPCRLSTDSKSGFTCLPRLINYFPEEFSSQLLVTAKRGFI